MARFGCVFINLVLETLPSFKGDPQQNDYTSGFAGKGYHPALCIGQALMGLDELPTCIIWIHVNDLLIHAPTYDKCLAGLREVLDLCACLGFLCQCSKTTPPVSCVKYCGFLYDTSGIPTIQIPSDKISRAIGQLAYILRLACQLSCLALAITVGNLNSLVPASPNNIGASFLRHVYTDLHAKHNQTYTTPLEFYYEEVVLSPLGRLDLTWWLTALTTGLETSIQPTKHAHLGVAWGDGSSSGTGGTFEWVAPDSGPLPVMCTWMGTWTPFIASRPIGANYAP